jgi:hypothetical protein
VERLFAEPDREIWNSRLSIVEIQSVCAMKIRGGFLTPEKAEMQRERLMAADNEVIEISYPQASGEYRRVAICVNMPKTSDPASRLSRHFRLHEILLDDE